MPPDLLLIVFGTFVSEDLTTAAVGLLVQQGRIGFVAGAAACALGIYLGDLALWGLGRLAGHPPFLRRWIAARLPARRLETWLVWFDAHAGRAILGSRFVPGSRLPLYLAAGFARTDFRRFAGWTLVAAALWTPLVVAAAQGTGAAFLTPLERLFGARWIAQSAAVALAVVLWQAGSRLARPAVRQRLWARLSRVWRWEFWPAWLFYQPVAAWLLLLAVRYRGLHTMTAANPGIADGGVAGESKHAILEKLPRPWVLDGVLIAPGPAAERLARLESIAGERGWTYPLILKPDVGQRGAGVRLVTDAAGALEYFGAHGPAVLAQTYHPGPYEAGIFYYRRPEWPNGRVLSITDKQFPVVTGDGRSTLEALVWNHPRYRMQAARFLRRHAARRHHVLAAGERLQLALAGNHAQGTLFRDGRHLLTPELEARVDEIARSIDGFFVGRFDVRYRDPGRFARGLDFAIVELNGATAESTDIYDPSGRLWRAYATLFRQWRIVFEIGDANRRRGFRPTPFRRFARLVATHVATRQPLPVSD